MSEQENNAIENFMERIIELKGQIEFRYAHFGNGAESHEHLTRDLRELMTQYHLFREQYKDAYKEFIVKNPQYSFLNILEQFSKDTEDGFYPLLKGITENANQTIVNILQYFQTNDFYQWTKRAVNSGIKEYASSPQEEAMFLELGRLSLPQIKREEMGDCLGLAFSGKLSANYNEIHQHVNQAEQVKYVRNLMARERVYVYWDFDSLVAQDKTAQYRYGHGNCLYRPRGLAAPKMIDSTYVDDKNGILYVTVCTNDMDTSKQGAQLFEIHKTLEEASKRGDLKIGGDKNLKPSVMFFNQAFFCTQPEEEVKVKVSAGRGKKGENLEKEGYHHFSSRKDFEDLMGDYKVSKDQMDKLNGLVTLSVLGNSQVSWPRFPHTFDITDIIHCQPVTAGACTLWLHTKFEQLKIYEQPKRSEKMFNFLLDYCQEVGDILNRAKTQDTQDRLLHRIKDSYERTLKGLVNNFNSYNLQRDINDEEAQKIAQLTQTLRQFNKQQRNSQIDKAVIGGLDVLAKGGFIQNGEDIEDSQQHNLERLEENKKKLVKLQHEKERRLTNKDMEKVKQKDELECALLGINKDSFEQLLSKVEELGHQIYNSSKSRGKKMSLSNHVRQVAGISYMMLQTGYSFTSTLNNIGTKATVAKDYVNPEMDTSHLNFGIGVYGTFLLPSGSSRKKFVQTLQKLPLEEADKLANADTLVLNFLNLLSSREGLKKVIEKGGLEEVLKTLVTDLEDTLTPERGNKFNPK